MSMRYLFTPQSLSRVQPSSIHRNLSSGRVMAQKDWSATQYLKFEDERTLPARDLLARVPLQTPKKIVDLGCGPGNSTAVLADRYPHAHLMGMDSSPDMIQKAKSSLPEIEFSVDDLRSYSPPPSVDLFFSNAVLQWLKRDERMEVVKKLMETQPSGGVFAFQVPDNLTEPSHVAMTEVAAQGPWATNLASVSRDVFQTPQEIYDQLKPISSEVNVFRLEYYHSLENHEAIMQWVAGTGLRPYVDPLSAEEKEEFRKEYLKRLENVYPRSIDGRVLLRYPRLFVVVVKK
ncbi:hypothetical protein EYZ11_003477 [Aspergillus tanneri]|uniref:Methyltransferase domain-containing protein n=1 Tax=Aspergillus tanneri TaxID=1220188 RepID=A0A4V3UPZ4_9EURO|nr:hypothetical protein EYZ11_003477 [Aspergillus tanneri]